jgi:predicted dehydrogenase
MAIVSELGAQDSPRRPIRVGVLGMGSRGSSLAETIGKTPGLTLAGWYDPCEKAERRALARFGGEVGSAGFESELELLRSPLIDAVFVASPSDCHFRQILEALEAGKHVFSEKPAASGHEEFERLEAKVHAAAEGRVFMTGFQRRYDPRVVSLSKWVQEGHLGPLVDIRADWVQPLGPPRGNGEWMLDPRRTGDWVAEHGDHVWDLLGELRPSMPQPRVVLARRMAGAESASAYWKAVLIWPDGVSVDVRQSFLPGGHFASPGLSVIVQCEKGVVDLLQGRVACARTIVPPTPITKEADSDRAMLEAFALRISDAAAHAQSCHSANMTEFRKLRYVDRLRSSVQESFEI